MKKVNSMKKKVISTGLAISLLASSAGVSQCFAQNTEGNYSKTLEFPTLPAVFNDKSNYNEQQMPTLPENIYNIDGYGMPEIPLLPADDDDQAVDNMQQMPTLPENIYNIDGYGMREIPPLPADDDDAQDGRNIIPLTPPLIDDENQDKGTLMPYYMPQRMSNVESQGKPHIAHGSQQKKNTSKFKNFAKTTAKVVATAALVGAAGYTCYKHPNEIKSVAEKAGNYFVTNVPKVWDETKNMVIGAKEYAKVIGKGIVLAGKGTLSAAKWAFKNRKAIGKGFVGATSAIGTCMAVNEVANKTSKIKKAANILVSPVKPIFKVVKSTCNLVKPNKKDGKIKKTAKKTAKVVATAALVGAAGYVCCQYPNEIKSAANCAAAIGKGTLSAAKAMWKNKKVLCKGFVGVTSAVGTCKVINEIAAKTSKLKKSVKELTSTTKATVKLPFKVAKTMLCMPYKGLKAVKSGATKIKNIIKPNQNKK